LSESFESPVQYHHQDLRGLPPHHYIIKQAVAVTEDKQSTLEHYRIRSGNMACDLLKVFSRIKITSVICRLPFNEMKNCIGIKE
jgi:hypothetical protein